MFTDKETELLQALIKVIDERINTKAQEAFNINDLFTDEMISNLVDKVVLSTDFSNKVYDEVSNQLSEYDLEVELADIKDVTNNIDDIIENFIVNNSFELRRM